MPELKSRDDLKELIFTLNEFMGHEDKEDPKRLRVAKSTPTDVLDAQLTAELKRLFKTNFDGKGFSDVPVPLLVHSSELGIAPEEDEDEEPTPKKKGKKSKPEPEPEPEDDEDVVEEPEDEPIEDVDDSDGDADDEPAQSPKKGPTLANATQLDLVAGANSGEIANALLVILSRLAEVGKVTIIVGDGPTTGPVAVASSADSAMATLKLMRARLRNGDLATREERIKFIKKNNISVPESKVTDCADKSLARCITKWAEAKARGLD